MAQFTPSPGQETQPLVKGTSDSQSPLPPTQENIPYMHQQPPLQPVVSPIQYAQQPPLQQLSCEVDPTHATIGATKKCGYCSKLMCLKCSNNVMPNLYMQRGGYYNNGINAWGMAGEACNPCCAIVKNVRDKYSWMMPLFILGTVFGSMLIFPLSIAIIVLGFYFYKKMPNDQYHSMLRRMCLIYAIINLSIFAMYGLIAVIVGLCLIPVWIH